MMEQLTRADQKAIRDIDCVSGILGAGYTFLACANDLVAVFGCVERWVVVPTYDDAAKLRVEVEHAPGVVQELLADLLIKRFRWRCHCFSLPPGR